tara:strand:- start:322 stop:918 length:597 start_codon:yes stop_codon:yes gene_type:complete
MSGIIAWNYFNNCLISTSSTFTSNASLFGKVYFPRIIVPASKIISGLFTFLIQLVMFVGFYIYYTMSGNESIEPEFSVLLLIPLMILQMALLGQGIGMIISSLTTKYRDLNYLVTFGTQLVMYASPIIYPLSEVPDKYKIYIILNPITPIIEGFRYGFLGRGMLNAEMITYSVIMTALVFISGLLIFNKVEKSFIDTV